MFKIWDKVNIISSDSFIKEYIWQTWVIINIRASSLRFIYELTLNDWAEWWFEERSIIKWNAFRFIT